MSINIADRSGAIAAAEKEVLRSLTKSQKSCVMLLDPVRELDWVTKNIVDVRKKIKNSCDQDAVCSNQRRYQETETPFGQCRLGLLDLGDEHHPRSVGFGRPGSIRF